MGHPFRLVIIRHGESARNKAKGNSLYFPDDASRKDVRGIPDDKIPLTQLGLEQARATGIALQKRFEPPDFVFNSGYMRTIQTMEETLKAYSEKDRARMKISRSIFIRERDTGYTYDLTDDEVRLRFPDAPEYWSSASSFFAYPPGGESSANVTTRVQLFINMLAYECAGRQVHVHTHAGTTRAFRFLLENWDYDQARSFNGQGAPPNCGVTIYEYDHDVRSLVLREYNTVYWK